MRQERIHANAVRVLLPYGYTVHLLNLEDQADEIEVRAMTGELVLLGQEIIIGDSRWVIFPEYDSFGLPIGRLEELRRDKEIPVLRESQPGSNLWEDYFDE